MKILNFIFSLFLPSTPEICFDYEYKEDRFSEVVRGSVCAETEDGNVFGALAQCNQDLNNFYFNVDYLIITECYVN